MNVMRELITATPMLLAPTLRAHTTAHVCMDILEMA